MKKCIVCCFIIATFLLLCVISIKQIFFVKPLDVKPIELVDIKSVQIVNMSIHKDRKDFYEKMLKNNFGEEFLGHKIGEEIRLNAVVGKTDVVFENLFTHEKYDYDKAKNKEEELLSVGIWKIYSKHNPDIYLFFNKFMTIDWNFNYFNKAGCHLSLYTAITNVARQPKGTYGIIFEDDFAVDKDFYSQLQMILSKAPKFDLLKISLPQYLLKKNITSATSLRAFLRKPSIITSMLNSYKHSGYGEFVNVKYQQNNALSYGNQGFVISQGGAEKLVKFFQNNIHYLSGLDKVLWGFLPKKDVIVSYVYTGLVPVLLSEKAFISSTSN